MFTARARTSVSRTLEETGGAITGLSPAGAGALNTARQPTSQQLRQLFIHAAIPMVGFGLMDNTVMIQVGDYIDGSLGVMLGLNTLTAAAMGQVFSDVSGVLFGSSVEAGARSLGLPVPSLSAEQRALSACRRVATAGSVFGVMLGCTLAMTQLLFMDLGKADRERKALELETICKSVVRHGSQTLKAERSTLYLADHSEQKLFSLAHGTDRFKAGDFVMPFSEGLGGHVVRHGAPLVVDDAYSDRPPSALSAAPWYTCNLTKIGVLSACHPNSGSHFTDKFDKASGFKTKSALTVPVLDDSATVVGVVQFINKQGGGGFTKHDLELAVMLAGHVAIFMDAQSSS